jgi:integrase/recombinase XerD
MLEDISVRRFRPDTQREYIRAVKRLSAFLGRSPDTATPEERRAFQLHLTATGVQPPTINATVTALRFFFKVTLDRPETTRRLVFVYEPRKLPRERDWSGVARSILEGIDEILTVTRLGLPKELRRSLAVPTSLRMS